MRRYIFRLLCLIGIALLTASSAVASGFTGKWVGAGLISDPRTGRSDECDLAEIWIEQTGEHFFVEGVWFRCGVGSQWQWRPTRFDLKNGGLFTGTRRVGTLTADTAALDLSNDEFDWRVRFELKGGKLVYTELLQSTEVAVELSGELARP